ncbi:hypothetical protein HWV62_32848 [Athelia sp. TMB]|nr:hypothetical protein HWV62_32848 [Athelia sp. TMB]
MSAYILFDQAYDHLLRRVYELLDVRDILNVSSTATVAWAAWRRYCAGVFAFDRLTSKYFESHMLFKQLLRDTSSVLLATSVIFMLRRGPPGDRPLDILIEARHLKAYEAYILHQEGYEPWIHNSHRVQDFIHTLGQDRPPIASRQRMLVERELRSQERAVAAVFTFYKEVPNGGWKYVRVAVATTSIMKSVLSASTSEGMAFMTDSLVVVLYPYATFVRKESLAFKHRPSSGPRRHLHFQREPYEIVDRSDFWYDDLADIFKVGPGSASVRAVGDNHCWTIFLESSGTATEAHATFDSELTHAQLSLNRWSLIVEDGVARVQSESVHVDAISSIYDTLRGTVL